MKEIKARISVIGNCQSEALAWYIRRLPQMREGAKKGNVVCNWLVAEKFREHMRRVNKEKFTKHLFLHTNPANVHRLVTEDKGDFRFNIFKSEQIRKSLQASDYVIFQKIRPSTSKLLNWQNVKILARDDAKLISISSFFHDKKDNKFVLEMAKREAELKVLLRASKLIKNNKKIDGTNLPNHPNVFYFLDLVKEICRIYDWEYFSDEEVEKYSKIRFPFG